MVRFELLASDGNARRGVIHTRHGPIETPGFFAVATRAALKAVDPDVARSVGVDALIVNSYHLEMRPGAGSVAHSGGLHDYMAWTGPLATDSGGFQVFSLRYGNVADELKGRRRLPDGDGEPLDAVRVDEEGADFRSYVDGSRHRFTPESSVEMQREMGADILFTLDECTPFHVPYEYTREATHRNLRWAIRCLDTYERLGMEQEQALFGIVHGGVYPELRTESARAISMLPFAGFGIGDCLGESKEDWYRVVDLVCPMLPTNRPRHLLGVGEPDDMVEGALRGIDTFDCAMPTRIARHGQALHPAGRRYRLDLAAAPRAEELGPIEEGCDCRTCARFSRAYLHHLLRSRELLGYSLIAEHNLRFIARLLGRVRQAIEEGRLEELRAELAVSRLDPGGR